MRGRWTDVVASGAVTRSTATSNEREQEYDVTTSPLRVGKGCTSSPSISSIKDLVNYLNICQLIHVQINYSPLRSLAVPFLVPERAPLSKYP